MSAPLLLEVNNTTLQFNYGQSDAALFLALGAAVAEVQVLEFHLVQTLGMLLSNEKTSHSEITGEYFQKTLGTVARKLRGEVGNMELAAVLEKVVHDRNHLIHGFLRSYQWPMMSPKDYIKAIQELDSMTCLFRDSAKDVTIALRKARDINVVVITFNSETGLPEVQ